MTIRLSSIFTFSIFLVFLAACATIPQADTWLRETNSLAYVVEDAEGLAKTHGTERVLVVFDIDNTLMAMEQGLGSDQWYDWQSKLRLADPCDARLVSDRLAVQGALYYVSAMRPTQEDAAQLVQRLQDDGLNVIALTSRALISGCPPSANCAATASAFTNRRSGPKAVIRMSLFLRAAHAMPATKTAFS